MHFSRDMRDRELTNVLRRAVLSALAAPSLVACGGHVSAGASPTTNDAREAGSVAPSPSATDSAALQSTPDAPDATGGPDEAGVALPTFGTFDADSGYFDCFGEDIPNPSSAVVGSELPSGCAAVTAPPTSVCGQSFDLVGPATACSPRATGDPPSAGPASSRCATERPSGARQRPPRTARDAPDRRRRNATRTAVVGNRRLDGDAAGPCCTPTRASGQGKRCRGARARTAGSVRCRVGSSARAADRFSGPRTARGAERFPLERRQASGRPAVQRLTAISRPLDDAHIRAAVGDGPGHQTGSEGPNDAAHSAACRPHTRPCQPDGASSAPRLLGRLGSDMQPMRADERTSRSPGRARGASGASCARVDLLRAQPRRNALYGLPGMRRRGVKIIVH
jgi:hypothetical protein